jgi:exonuclease SbcC
MEVELAKIRWECESANKKLKEAASLFKTICMKYQLSHEDKRTLVHCPDLTPCRQVDVEKAQNHLEWLRGLLYRAQEELQCFRSEVSDNIPDSSVLLDRKRKLEVDKEALKDAMSKLKYDLRQRKELEKEMKSTRERYECLDQAYDVALKLQRYSDGKNFVRFLSDTILKELLGAVNESLSSKGFSLTAESGKLYAVVNGFKRDAASLSGGERAIVALLMLRHLANKVGFKQVLFIDEGLAMLDDENLEMMLDLFDDLGREAFVGVITHDSDFASLFPKRIEVEAGRIRLVKN